VTTSPQSFDRELDARGLFCPEPVMLLHREMRFMAVGERLRVVATDASTQRDIPKFCEHLGHELLASGQTDDEFHFLICKQ
jgi:tRNA 2-thiouridine synthesizing protein A